MVESVQLSFATRYASQLPATIRSLQSVDCASNRKVSGLGYCYYETEHYTDYGMRREPELTRLLRLDKLVTGTTGINDTNR